MNRINSSNVNVYVDGVLYDTLTGFSDDLEVNVIGEGKGNAYFNGSIDDVMIFNRSLSAGEVGALYANQSARFLEINFTSLDEGGHTFQAYTMDEAGNVNTTGQRVVTIDYTLPGAANISPLNASYSTNTTQNFTMSFTDNIGLSNFTLYVYNGTGLFHNETGPVTGTTDTASVLLGGMTDGPYEWFFTVRDLAGNGFTAQANHTLTVDTASPLISFVSPTPENGSGRTEQFTVNISITETNLANVTFSWNGTNSTYTPEENASYFSGNPPNWNFNLTQTGLETGRSYTYYALVADKAGQANITSTRTIVGNVKPGFGHISFEPNNTYGMDPGISITVRANITDSDNNLDSAILQWKKAQLNWSEAINVTMNNLTAKGLYVIMNASFTPLDGANYTFRIWANDTESDFNTSNAVSIPVFYDWTWNIDSTFSVASGLYGTKRVIGNFTVNNTGDYTMTFFVTDDSPYGDFGLEFDGLNSPQFSLASNQSHKMSRTLVVNATFGSATREDNVTITVTASPGANANPPSRTYSFNLISYAGGPYLYLVIPEYPSLVYHGDTGRNFTAKIRNMGNETARNTTLNWTFPSGWFASQGNLSAEIGSIPADESNLSSILLAVDKALAVPGTVTVTASVRAEGNVNDTESVSVTVSCKSGDGYCGYGCNATTDADCAPVQTITETSPGGGGIVQVGGGGLSPEQKSKLFRTEEKFQLVRGEDNNFTITITNPLDEMLENVTLSIEGFTAGELKLDRTYLGTLQPNQSVNITVYIGAPKYLSRGLNTLKVTIRGMARSGFLERNITEERVISLIIHEISRQVADELLNSTRQLLEAMKTMGMKTVELEGLLLKSKASLLEGNYIAVKENEQNAREIFRAAVETKTNLDITEDNVARAEYDGISVPQTKRLFNLAKSAFERGDYFLAKSRVEEAMLTFAAETKGEFNVLVFILRNWWQTGLAAIALVIVSFFVYLRIRLAVINRRLSMLGKEEKILLSLIKEVQRECFEKGKLSMKEYKRAVAEYEKKLSGALAKRVRLDSVKLHLMSFNRLAALKYEERVLIRILKRMQGLYLVQGKMEAHVYDSKVKSIRERLAVVEEEITTREAERQIMKRTTARGKILDRLGVIK